MFSARAGFGTFSKAAVDDVNSFNVAIYSRVLVLTVLLTIMCMAVAAQSLNLTITEFPIPTPNAVPLVITSGPDGAMWFAEKSGNRIGRITASGAMTEFNVPTPSA